MKPQFLRTDWDYLINVLNIDWFVVMACENVSGFKIVASVVGVEMDVCRFATEGEAGFAMISIAEEIANGTPIVRAAA